MISVIRGRFRVLRYGLSVLRLAIQMIAKKSNQIASLPSAGNCGYAHPSTPYQITVTKMWYITTKIKNGFKNLIIDSANDKYGKNIFVRTIKTTANYI
jgi:hypothetical protein